jgi:AhpD family alkylhydroperoxidase
LAVINYRKLQPRLYEAMHHLQHEIDESGVEPRLLEILKLRASQINGCAFCVNMHANAARDRGESDARLHLVSAWRHARSFTAPERAALRWCEEITLQASAPPSDGALEDLQEHFSEDQIVSLTWAIAAINAWNRIAVPLGQLGGPLPSEASVGDRASV